MNTRTNQPSTVPSAPTRIILASANRHELHSAGRQERALKTLRKMRRFDDNELLEEPHVHRISSADESSVS